jgi:enoyl-CoA hydratase/carnithine racemase
VGQICYEVDNGIASIVIDNPDKRNAVDRTMSAQLAEAYDDVVVNENVRVVVIRGAGHQSFCAGASISGYLADGVLGENATKQRSALPKPWRIYKPVIAAIEGYCVGGGFALALACDIRVVTTASTLGPSGHKRGVANGTQQATRLVRLVGLSNALEVLLLSKYIDGTEAHRIGLAQRLVEPGAALATAMEIATTIASFSPDAVQATKRLAYDSADLTWEEALDWELVVSERSFRTADSLEGFAAFAEKRSPVWGKGARALHELGLDELWPSEEAPRWRK